MLKAVAALGGSRPGVRTELVEDDFEAVRTGDHFAYVVDHWKQYDKDDQITAEFRSETERSSNCCAVRQMHTNQSCRRCDLITISFSMRYALASSVFLLSSSSLLLLLLKCSVTLFFISLYRQGYGRPEEGGQPVEDTSSNGKPLLKASYGQVADLPATIYFPTVFAL